MSADFRLKRSLEERGRKIVRSALGVSVLFALLTVPSVTVVSAGTGDVSALLARMHEAYGGVRDYETRLDITGFGDAARFGGTLQLLYAFKKPGKIRIEFKSPHKGMVILYPDREGKVAVRPSALLPFLVFHLAPESDHLEISPGQHIPETDLGMLIRNITLCTTELSLGDLDISESDSAVIIRVLSDNPFKRGVPTRYRFTVDKRLWLPSAVEEMTPSGTLRRRVVYRDLRVNVGVPDSAFEMD